MRGGWGDDGSPPLPLLLPVLQGFLILNGRRRNHFARASGPPEAGLRAGLAGVRSSLARSARRRRLKPPGARPGAAGPHGTPLTPAVGAGPLVPTERPATV